MLSFLDREPVAPQVSCGITHTNERTHDIIRANLSQSAMYGGLIEGVGPRYCPSIEDKIVRFANKASHQVFLEPEGIADNTVYPNGISTSLPAGIQLDYVQSIAGLEAAKITQPGYAIEYDYFDPCGLSRGLQVRGVAGLYFAGQINGTTGYEEAAAQGLLAGLNAARHAKGTEDIVLQRSESYIGVMIDDLVTQGVTEPYRMFTSRAEYRLSLRVDNADQRLTPLGLELGCIGQNRAEVYHRKMEKLQTARSIMKMEKFSPNNLETVGIAAKMDGVRRSVLDILAFPNVSLEQIKALVPEICSIDAETLDQLRRESLYVSYEARQSQQLESVRRDEDLRIPQQFAYCKIPGLSVELQQKLERSKPETLAQASRIEGMTPAAMALIHLRLKSVEPRSPVEVSP